MEGQSRKDTRGVMSGFTVVVANYRIEATYGAYGHLWDTDHLEMGGRVVMQSQLYRSSWLQWLAQNDFLSQSTFGCPAATAAECHAPLGRREAPQ